MVGRPGRLGGGVLARELLAEAVLAMSMVTFPSSPMASRVARLEVCLPMVLALLRGTAQAPHGVVDCGPRSWVVGGSREAAIAGLGSR
jgi:hypothetical protein